MVRFEKDKYIIEIPAPSGPVEEWQNLHGELTDLLGSLRGDAMPPDGIYWVSTLLREMMPDWETARSMARR